MNQTLTVRSAFGIVMISVFTAFLAGYIVLSLASAVASEQNQQLIIYISFFTGEGFLILPLLVFLSIKNESIRSRLRLHPVSVRTAAATGILSVGIVILADELDRLAGWVFPEPDQLVQIVELLTPSTFGSAILLVFAIVVFAPLGEEILFRGFLQQFLEVAWRDVTRAVLVTSLLFALIHLNPYWVIQIYLLGIILGYLAWKTGSILPSLILHGINNGIALAFTGVNENSVSLYTWHGHVAPYWLLLAVALVILGFKWLHASLGDPS